jgi:hypothetical protein
MDTPITALFRSAARARSIKPPVLRTIVETNIRSDLDANDQDRLRRIVLTLIIDGTITLEASLRRTNHSLEHHDTHLLAPVGRR